MEIRIKQFVICPNCKKGMIPTRIEKVNSKEKIYVWYCMNCGNTEPRKPQQINSPAISDTPINL